MTTDGTRPFAAELLRDLRNARRLPSWFADQPERIVKIVQAAGADSHAEAATQLLVEIWPLLPDDVGEDVLRGLHECGVALAPVLPTSLLLAKAFSLGASVLRTRGLHTLAAIQGMHELAIHRLRDDDPESAASALFDLAETYRDGGLMHKVIGCADEALETYGIHGEILGFVRTLVRLGSLMIEVGRYDSAIRYLARADTTYKGAEDAQLLALCRALLSRAHRLHGDNHAANRHLNRALALVVGVDQATAQHVRDLAAGKTQLDASVLSYPNPHSHCHRRD